MCGEREGRDTSRPTEGFSDEYVENERDATPRVRTRNIGECVVKERDATPRVRPWFSDEHVEKERDAINRVSTGGIQS